MVMKPLVRRGKFDRAKIASNEWDPMYYGQEATGGYWWHCAKCGKKYIQRKDARECCGGDRKWKDNFDNPNKVGD